ncbi:alpha/beta hydrolase [Mycolicibacterium conceptionense]|jgi:pimeloyl-ACP methyl ester carboxylesterase|uniref:Alpha/beta hydrolase n=1 Tax=Mycolicibacterium conceptionense TaxID=451644 RepID=A0A0J8U3L5_9MYCO|nr:MULTISPECIES: alpha/beta fold hydrolase [Mycolicibacterium]KMV15035.1 alpha/beta hydrolase [Mycolicibacterium conceptionense]MCW1823577.1 alpha/beta fold hydrolase [Mycolicibacterium senegalense]OBB10101.1 alpha/beta hydrolase [Mycolicibacterium conceptionense]OBF08947.1 alpha/beta hydrolase [Mycolicibacterium conceptionense]OBF28850.1 alpha/beta hydrolase [Mycolicibacterium conceptionense]
MDSPVEHRTLAVDGVRSPVLVGGPAASDNGEAVVFVHGNNAGAKWDRLLAPVAGFTRVIAPEMPGFGAADKPTQWPYTVPAYAAHLGAILDQLGVRRAHLVAHDFGGPWALAWAADHLDSAASITLINAPVVINHFAAKLWRTPVLAEALSRIGNPAVLRRVLAMRDPGLPADALESIAEHMFARGTPDAVLKLYRSTGPNALAPYVDRLAEFSGDVLVVWGAEDRYVPFSQTDEYRRIFGSCQVQPIPGTGHWPWLEQPDVVAGHLTTFLRTQLRSAR